ncbi:glycosyltransferase family 4 protein [Spirosoma luteolum]
MSDQLRIAIVTTHPPGKGTLNEYGYYLVQHFRQNASIAEVILIVDELPDGLSYQLDGPGCPVRIETVWAFNRWLNPMSILRAVRRHKPDVVLFNMQFLSFGDQKIPAALGLHTPLLVKMAGFPTVALLHNIMEEVDLRSAGFAQHKAIALAFQKIGSLLTRVILSSDLVTVTIAKYVEVLENKYQATNVALIPHGSFELPAMPDFSLPPGPFTVMTFGKFGTYKRVEVLIEAVVLVRRRTQLPIRLVIAGTDSPNKAGYLASIRAQYAEVPMLEFTGYVDEADVPRVFRESAVVVFPYSSTTGSSGVLHQAGSYGRAAILPNIGDLAHLIQEEGYAGAFFEPEQVGSLADALQSVLENDEYRRELALTNYLASVTLPMADIVDWYYLHFLQLLKEQRRLLRGTRPVPAEIPA